MGTCRGYTQVVSRKVTRFTLYSSITGTQADRNGQKQDPDAEVDIGDVGADIEGPLVDAPTPSPQDQDVEVDIGDVGTDIKDPLDGEGNIGDPLDGEGKIIDDLENDIEPVLDNDIEDKPSEDDILKDIF